MVITLICIIFVINGFLPDYKLLFDTEFKSENHFAQSALVFFYSTFIFWKYQKFPKENIGFHLNYFTYFLLFLVYGLQVREKSAVRGREIIEWEGRQGRSNES